MRLSSKKNGKPTLRAKKMMNWWEKVKEGLKKGWHFIDPFAKEGAGDLIEMGMHAGEKALESYIRNKE